MPYTPCTHTQYNWCYDVVVSGDESGMLEYWGGPAHTYSFPKNVKFEHKTDTDLYEFVRHKTIPMSLTFSPDGKLFAVMARDRKVKLSCSQAPFFNVSLGMRQEGKEELVDCVILCRYVCSPS